MATAAEIVTFDTAPPPPGSNPWVGGAPPVEVIEIVPADPRWPAVYDDVAARVRDSLGPRALDVDHVGSTSVPGLPAKPVIDIDLTVADPGDEAAWLPALEAAGFVLTVREPWWQEHRCLRHAAPRCNLHVFGPGSAETARHRIFRDWLREHPQDRDLYRDAKLAAASESNDHGEHVMEYNARKQRVVREIYRRAFAAAALLD